MKSDDETLQIEITIAPAKGRKGGQRRNAGGSKVPDPPRIPRITRLMALAIKFQDMVDCREVRDYADLARLGYVTVIERGSLPVYTWTTRGEPLRPKKWTTRGEPLWNYARVPREVVCDRELKLLDIRVYCMLAGSVWQGSTARMGTRLLAAYTGAARRLVVDSLRPLETRGHLQKAAGRRGQRPIYVLTSPVFGQKQPAGIEEIIGSPSRALRLASVRTD